MKKQQPERLKSLDALRGVDIFRIMGAEAVFILIGLLTGSPALQRCTNQMAHVKRHGFHAYDIIFQLFLFIAGVSFPFSAKECLNTDRWGTEAALQACFKKKDCF